MYEGSEDANVTTMVQIKQGSGLCVASYTSNCHYTLYMQVCEHVCLCCFFCIFTHDSTYGLRADKGPNSNDTFVRFIPLQNQKCFDFSSSESNDVPWLCDTVPGVSCGKNALTTTCLTVNHLITPECLI